MNATSKLEIRAIESENETTKFDFFIDDIELDQILNINRLSDLRFCGFDLDIFQVDNQKFPNYNRLDIVKSTVETFLGNAKPLNQFLTDRIVVYRCHCGCDYCGVISLKINFDDNYAYWTDIRFELDDEATDEVKPITIFRFDKTKYFEEFNRFMEKHCA